MNSRALAKAGCQDSQIYSNSFGRDFRMSFAEVSYVVKLVPRFRNLALFSTAFAVRVFVTSISCGAIVVTATQSGDNVVLEGSGSIDLSALTEITGTATSFGSAISGNPPAFTVGGTNQIDVDVYGGFSLTAPSNIGVLTSAVFADSGTGDRFGASRAQVLTSGVPVLIVPEAYTSNSELSGSAVFAGTSFATLGITPGIYEWTWGTGTESDSLSLQVIPEPGTWMLLLVAGGILSFIRRELVL